MIEQKADYVLALKANQGTLRDDVCLFLDDPETPLDSATEIDKGHGRIETRSASLSTDIAWLQDGHGWPGLKAVGKVVASREIGRLRTTETRYYLLSKAIPPARFNNIVRSHWSIENQLHWVLDVVFDEDQARNRRTTDRKTWPCCASSPLNLAQLEPSQGSMRGKLKRAAGTMPSSQACSHSSQMFKCDSPDTTGRSQDPAEERLRAEYRWPTRKD